MTNSIRLKQVSENNLKHIDVEIPYYKHTVIAGVSGSGKSTLAYDVIYASAQRKLLDCMSDQEKIFSSRMKKPKVESIEGLSAVISLKQIKPNHNPRSTIGTYTNIGSYIRNLMALHGECRCLSCEKTFRPAGFPALVRELENLPADTVVEVSFPYFFTLQKSRGQQLETLRQKGFRHIYVNDEKKNLRDFVEIGEEIEFILVVEGSFQAKPTLNKSDVNCLKNAGRHGDNYLSVRLNGADEEASRRFYQKHGCHKHHFVAAALDASDFSYNNVSCACPECTGSGITKIVHPSKVIKNPKKTLRQGPFYPDVYAMSHPYSYMSLYSLACHYDFPFDVPYEQLSEEAKMRILYGSGEESFLLQRPEGYTKTLPNYLAKEGKLIRFPGILTRIKEQYQEMLNDTETPSPAREHFFQTYMHETECPGCGGARLKKIRNYVMLCGKTYAQLGKMEFGELLEFFGQFEGNEAEKPILDALKERLELLAEIGLDYLCFERRIDSLSGGEYQRLRLANQVGSGLVGLTYIIDEPTDGLHGADTQKIINVIRRLLQKGSTVITIEHDFEVIKAADYVIELGPGAGTEGGRIIAAGTPKQLRENPDSLIGKYLFQKQGQLMREDNSDTDFTAAVSDGNTSVSNGNSSVEMPEKYSPKKTPEKCSPEKTPEKYSPEKTPEKYSPEKTPEKYSPEKTSEKYSPEKTSENGFPIKSPEDGSFAKRTKEDFPDRTPEKNASALFTENIPSIKITGIKVHNIKNADVEIPLNKITCFTGVSGSGKSSVVYEVLYKALCSKLQNACMVPGSYQKIEGFEALKNIICIDQALLNQKNTSVPATYLGLFDSVRILFSQSTGADCDWKDKKSYFSFNTKGACPACKGRGYIEKYIQYFGETRIICSECGGNQYIDEVLAVKYHGKNIKQVLDMTFSEASAFFEDQNNIYDKVRLACDLGLGYMQLGQPLGTISGGEAQRIKLVKEMTRYKNRKNLLYLFDEPSIGLHAKDVARMIAVMRRIVQAGNTIVLVEHNPEIILSSDYIIDLGPGAGKHGGEIMFTGTPQQLLKYGNSKTADYLRSI